MMKDIYATVEQNYDGVDQSFHAGYDTTSEFKTELKAFVEKLGEDSRLLNIGGTPVECNYFLNKGFRVNNVDISQAMLDEVASKSKLPRTKLIKQNIKNLTTRTPYDGVWACRSLIHIPPADIGAILNNIHSLLPENGYIGAVLFKSNAKDIEEQELPEEHSHQKGLIYYRVLYSRKALITKFEQANLKPISITESADQDDEPTIFILAQAV